MLLEALKVSKAYGRRSVLDQVSFTIPESGITGLIGPNGSGKTTLFEVLACVRSVDSGDVLFRGEPLRVRDRKSVLFYMPDGIQPWAEQSVEWLLRFYSGLHDAPPHRMDQLTEALQLGDFRTARAGSLSKGEWKRLLLAMSLLTPQPLLLLDEPFDGLDFRQTQEVMGLLKTVRDRTLFLSIHQLSDAARVCSKLILLSRGQVVGDGTLDELRTTSNVNNGGLEEIFLALT